MVTHYGYFLPATGTLYGNVELARECKEAWDRLELSGEFAGRYDGVSAWEDASGKHVRIVVRDFFKPEPTHIVKRL